MFNDDFDESASIASSVGRYEEMLRKKNHYFFDRDSFEQIIDYYIEHNDPVKALQAVEYALSMHQATVDIMIRQAQLLIMTHQFDPASNVLNLIEQIEPNNSDIFLLKGFVMEYMGYYNDALHNYKQVLTNSQVDVSDELYLQIAYLYQRMEDYERAIIYFKLCLGFNMDNYDAFLDLSVCFEKLNKEEDLIEFFEKYINEYPYDANAWYNLGESFLRLELYEKAIIAYEYATAIDDDLHHAHYGKGTALAEMGNYKDALEIFLGISQPEDDNSELYCSIAECYVQIEDTDKASHYYKESIKQNEGLADSWFGLGVLSTLEECWIESIYFFKKATAIDAHNYEYWFALGNAYANLNHFEDARTSYDKVLELEPSDIKIWLDYSSLLFEEGDETGAINMLLDGLKQIEDNRAELYYRMAVYMITSCEKRQEGLTYLEKALSEAPEEYNVLLEYQPKLENDLIVMDIIRRFQ
jgi:tetratricopeptide (TPR) repeat protein